MFCQDLTSKYFFVYGERAIPQAMAGPGSLATIVVIAVFLAALAFGLLFLLGSKRQTANAGAKKEQQEKPQLPTHREQAGSAAAAVVQPGRRSAVYTTGDGAGRLFRWLDSAVNLLFSGLISIYKRAFNYNEPATPAPVTVVSEETAAPAPALTMTPAVITPPMAPMVIPLSTVPALIQNLPVERTPAQPAATTPSIVQRRPPVPVPPPIANPRPVDRPYGLQAIIDIIGEGIETAFARMSDGIVFIFEGLINLFKWIFRIDR